MYACVSDSIIPFGGTYIQSIAILKNVGSILYFKVDLLYLSYLKTY